MQYIMRYKVGRDGHRTAELTAEIDQVAMDIVDEFVQQYPRAWAKLTLSNGAKYSAWTDDGRFFSQSELRLESTFNRSTKPAQCA